jgi:hypothetical protein
MSQCASTAACTISPSAARAAFAHGRRIELHEHLGAQDELIVAHRLRRELAGNVTLGRLARIVRVHQHVRIEEAPHRFGLRSDKSLSYKSPRDSFGNGLAGRGEASMRASNSRYRAARSSLRRAYASIARRQTSLTLVPSFTARTRAACRRASSIDKVTLAMAGLP